MDFDKNKDGVVTHEEFKEGIRSVCAFYLARLCV